MKRLLARSSILTLVLLASFIAHTWADPLGTAFTYQGRLNDGGNHAQGIYDLRFAIYDAGGSPSLADGPVTTAPVPLANGLLTVALDFGPGAFAGDAPWMELGLRPNGGSGAITTLAPRQPFTSTPFQTEPSRSERTN